MKVRKPPTASQEARVFEYSKTRNPTLLCGLFELRLYVRLLCFNPPRESLCCVPSNAQDGGCCQESFEVFQVERFASGQARALTRHPVFHTQGERGEGSE